MEQEPEQPAAPEPPPAPEARRYPSTIGGVFYLVVLGVTVAGLVITWAGDWRLGTRWVGVALLLAAVVRLVLRAKDAGMLAVRHRFFDCAVLTVVGVAMLFLASTIPNQPV